MRGFLGENDMMAYLAMMAVRLIELHRVLKPTGSLYLHCDPTASHYLKILLDAVFGRGTLERDRLEANQLPTAIIKAIWTNTRHDTFLCEDSMSLRTCHSRNIVYMIASFDTTT